MSHAIEQHVRLVLRGVLTHSVCQFLRDWWSVQMQTSCNQILASPFAKDAHNRIGLFGPGCPRFPLGGGKDTGPKCHRVMVPLFVTVFQNGTHCIVTGVRLDAEGLVMARQEEGKRLQQVPLQLLEGGVWFRRPIQGVLIALSRFRVGEFEHGVKGGRMMSINIYQLLVVVGKTEECPELRNRVGLVPLLQAGDLPRDGLLESITYQMASKVHLLDEHAPMILRAKTSLYSKSTQKAISEHFFWIQRLQNRESPHENISETLIYPFFSKKWPPGGGGVYQISPDVALTTCIHLYSKSTQRARLWTPMAWFFNSAPSK